MGRAKGTPKTGGRKKGTPNKATATLKEWLISLLDNNRKQVEQDLQALESKSILACTAACLGIAYSISLKR